MLDEKTAGVYLGKYLPQVCKYVWESVQERFLRNRKHVRDRSAFDMRCPSMNPYSSLIAVPSMMTRVPTYWNLAHLFEEPTRGANMICSHHSARPVHSSVHSTPFLSMYPSFLDAPPAPAPATPEHNRTGLAPMPPANARQSEASDASSTNSSGSLARRTLLHRPLSTPPHAGPRNRLQRPRPG